MDSYETGVSMAIASVPKSPTRTRPLRIAIFVQEEVLRLGLQAIVSTIPVIGALEVCDTWQSAVHLTWSGEVDVVVIHESDAGLAQTDLAGDSGRRAKVLMLLRDHEARDLHQLPFQPDGFVVQGDLSAANMANALLQVAAGEVPIPAPVARRLLQHAGMEWPAQRRQRPTLTGREAETLNLLAEGLSNKQIARRLHISSHGAKRIVASLLLKLDSPNRTTAVVIAIRTGLIQGIG
jgi:two-component system nitrate/nitrite response regulator NarL